MKCEKKKLRMFCKQSKQSFGNHMCMYIPTPSIFFWICHWHTISKHIDLLMVNSLTRSQKNITKSSFTLTLFICLFVCLLILMDNSHDLNYIKEKNSNIRHPCVFCLQWLLLSPQPNFLLDGVNGLQWLLQSHPSPFIAFVFVPYAVTFLFSQLVNHFFFYVVSIVFACILFIFILTHWSV